MEKRRSKRIIVSLKAELISDGTSFFFVFRIKLVGERGLEPPRVTPPDPKSGASASSATRPCFNIKYSGHVCSMSRRYVVNIKGFATILSNHKEFKYIFMNLSKAG